MRKLKLGGALGAAIFFFSAPAYAQPSWFTVSSAVGEQWYVDIGAPSQFANGFRTYPLLITKSRWAELGAHHMSALIQGNCKDQTYKVTSGAFVDKSGSLIKREMDGGWAKLADAPMAIRALYNVICQSGNGALFVKDVYRELDQFYSTFGKK